MIGVIGLPGTGKTVWTTELLMRLQATPCFVVCHDSSWRVPSVLPSGRPTGVVRHRSVAACREYMKRDGAGLHCISADEGDEVIDFARELGEASKARYGGRYAVPVHVALDEATDTEGFSASYMSKPVKRLLSQRRHEMVSVSFGVQAVTDVHHRLLSAMTTAVCFRMDGKKQLLRLEEHAKLPRDLVAQLPDLPDFAYRIYRKS